MDNTKHILFTFDYELFLGVKSGTVNNCLIKPTNSIIELLEKYSIKNAIFFVDTTYLMRLKNEGNKATTKDFEAVTDQLITLIKKGHYLFPHIHPHWLDAIYLKDLNQWSLSKHSKYRFHNINAREQVELFDQSIQILNNIAGSANSQYKINGYRAGGWSIQPFTDFIPFFEKHNIKHEFSVVKGFTNLSDAQYFDFSLCPSKTIYKFNEDPCVEVIDGKFIEYTISTMPISGFTYWLNKLWGKYLWKTGNRSIGDGISMVAMDNCAIKGKKDLIDSDNQEMLSIELLTKVKLPLYRRYTSSQNFIHFISHPKMLSRHNIKCFESYLKYTTSNYQLQTDFSHIPIN